MADKSSKAMSIRFLIDSKTRRILYAEAGKEFVDLLCSFLVMPIGSVLKLLSSSEVSMKVGSVTNLYDSLETLPSHFMSAEKSELLEPKFISAYSNNPLRIECGHDYYVCTHASYDSHVSYDSYDSYDSKTHIINTHNQGRCICGNAVNRPVRQNSNVNQGGSSDKSPSQHSGYVKDTVTFIITDDLKITGSSTITTITLLNRLNIKDLTELEERTAIVGRNKALELLGASLVSTTVLNDVFGAQFSTSPKKVSAVREEAVRANVREEEAVREDEDVSRGEYEGVREDEDEDVFW